MGYIHSKSMTHFDFNIKINRYFFRISKQHATHKRIHKLHILYIKSEGYTLKK